MTTAGRTDNEVLPEPRWGLGEPAWGFVLAQVSGLILGSAVISLAGQQAGTADLATLPLWALVLQAPPLWIGFISAPVWAARHRGNSVRSDFKLTIRRGDVLPAAAAGVFAQLVLVPAVSWPILRLTGSTEDDLSETARTIIDKAASPAGVVLLFAVVAIGAPIVEELFYRGLLMGAMEKRWATGLAVVGSSVLFGASHFEMLLFPGLFTAGLVFALARVVSGRLGPAIVAHMAFNATTIVVLLAT